MKALNGFCIAFCLALVSVGAPAHGEAPTGTERALGAFEGPQERVRLTPDGADGFYAVWVDGGSTVRVQRLGRNGVPVWSTPTSIASGPAAYLEVVGTKSGVFVVWSETLGGILTQVQFVDPNGRAKWTAPTRLNQLSLVRAISDGKNRLAILGETRTRSFALKLIDGAGAVVGGHDGIGSVFTDASGGPTDMYPVDVAAVAPGELVVAWGGATLNVKKIGGAAFGPVAVVSSFGNKSPVKVVADGSGGAVVLWGDRRRMPREADLFARRVDRTGRLLGSATGVELHRNIRQELQVASDGAGGAIAAFSAIAPQGSFVVPVVFAQRVTSAGAKAWSTSVRLDASTDSSRLPGITADGAGGAFVLQKTEPTVTGSGTPACLVTQRVASDGAPQFGAMGLRVGRCGAFPPQAVVAVGKDLMLAGWTDTRAGYPDAYLVSAPAVGARAPAVATGPAPAPKGGLPPIKKSGPRLPTQPGK